MLSLLLLPLVFAVIATIAYEKGGHSLLWGTFLATLAFLFFTGTSIIGLAFVGAPLLVATLVLCGCTRGNDTFALVLRAFFAAVISLVVVRIVLFFLFRMVRLPF
ncbi:MAG: hypothetical protein M3081_18245 [Gemmatimonadota bacterium]|nr:hypothetical protein [Gemmatimonadota bacterium]